MRIVMLLVTSVMLLSLLFSSFVWLWLSAKYKKNYKDDFDLWEKETIQKSLYNYKRKMELCEPEKKNIRHNIDILIAKWESVTDITPLNRP